MSLERDNIKHFLLLMEFKVNYNLSINICPLRKFSTSFSSKKRKRHFNWEQDFNPIFKREFLARSWLLVINTIKSCLSNLTGKGLISHQNSLGPRKSNSSSNYSMRLTKAFSKRMYHNKKVLFKLWLISRKIFIIGTVFQVQFFILSKINKKNLSAAKTGKLVWYF